MANRLAKESSPYLRQHADNPVDWYPWGPEALGLARQEDRPILLSVGYSACHWCHVMAHESFENKDTAQRMNRGFINIKVDREERPDLDQIYQGVLQLMGRGGGWPLTVFLTPDLKPYFAGTYFPPEDRYGMPGFPRLLDSLEHAWQHQRDDIRSQANRFEEGLGFLATYGLDSAPAELVPDDVVRAGRKLLEQIDPDHGGFGGAPKFPNPMNVSLLLRAYRRTQAPAFLQAVRLTLGKMADGGIYDQLGGGFHRYSVDARWLVPHFEKMLYDNAQLLYLYTEMYQVDPSPRWLKVVEETVAYIQREMTAPGGDFYSAQDADSEGEEGKFFVWTSGELDEVLGAEAGLFKAAYGVTEAGNFEHGASVLERQPEASVEEAGPRLAAARAKLFQKREGRVRPGLDDKVLAGWNGLMLRGLAFAGRVFHRPDWIAAAAKGADAVLSWAWKGDRLLRVHHSGQSKIEAFLEDYGDLSLGLLHVFQATSEVRYLEAAQGLIAQAREWFWDEGKQAYLTARRGQADLLTAHFALHDNAYPSGASTLTEAQVLFAALTGQTEPLAHAGAYLRKVRDAMAQSPFAFGHLWLAADSWLSGASEVTIVGEPEARAALERAFHQVYAPGTALLSWSPRQKVPALLQDTLAARTDVSPASAMSYLCKHFQCDAPTEDPRKLREQLLSA